MRGVVKFLLDMTLRKTAGSVPIVENESQKINNAFALNPSEFAIELGGVFFFSPFPNPSQDAPRFFDQDRCS